MLEQSHLEAGGERRADFLASPQLVGLDRAWAARMRSGVCAWVITIVAGATGSSRQPSAMRSICRAAPWPSLPAQISAAYGRPLMRSSAA